MLLDRHGKVGAALDRRIVGGDDTGMSFHITDTRNQTGSGDLVVVHPGCRQGTEFEPKRVRIEQLRDSLSGGQFAALSMKGGCLSRPSGSSDGEMFLEVRYPALIIRTIRRELAGGGNH